MRKSPFIYEFWSWWIFYIPAYFYGLYLALRSGTVTYFTAVNPCMRYSGAFAYSKYDFTHSIPEKYLPKTVHLYSKISIDELLEQMTTQGLDYPLILKPEEGERGVGVELLNDTKDLKQYLKNCDEGYYLLQEYIDYEQEYGLLYYRLPDGSHSEVISVTGKSFFTVEGDGIHNLEELVDYHPRIAHRIDYLKKKFGSQWHEVIPKGERLVVECIGNHSRGTTFLDANHLISSEMCRWIDELSTHLPGFYYGRLDIKVRDLASLQSGKGIKIIEINGVNSEAGHIYDPDYNIFQAYVEVFRQMRIIYSIAKQNRQRGVHTAPVFSFLKDLLKQLFGH